MEHGNNPKLKIALCGYEGEHNNLEKAGWRKVAWRASGGYAAGEREQGTHLVLPGVSVPPPALALRRSNTMTGWCASCGEPWRMGQSSCPCGWAHAPEDFYFPSGSNHLGEIRGFLMETPGNVGVTASELRDDAVQELLELPRWCIGELFLDSGAFSEVAFGPGGRRVVAPISEREWGRRLRLARELAQRWGERLWVVTPDCVGDQEETLRRLCRYRQSLQGLFHLGARLIFPVQRGRWGMAAFWVGSVEAAGFSVAFEWLTEGRILPGIPSKKDATPPEELHRFAQFRAEAAGGEGVRLTGGRPWLHWHFLGRGPRSRGYSERVASICRAWPESVVSSDSVLLRAVVGRGAGAARPLTRARDEVLVEGELRAEQVAAVKQEAIGRYFEAQRTRQAARARQLSLTLG